MTSNVTRFPIRQGTKGGVYCAPLNLHFPPLYRVVQTVTRAQLAAEGLHDLEPFAEFIHYALSDEEDLYLGTIVSQTVRRICDPDTDSRIIRHHRTLEEASVYLDAVMDICGGETIDPICRTQEGYFTLARRATDAAWPGPLIVYAAMCPANNLAGSEEWRKAVAPDGSLVPVDTL